MISMHITVSEMQQQEQQHALDIPEILALVGSFLPLWDPPSPNDPYSRNYIFQPKTLATSLQVSKLWYKTLLPILWYGYWDNSMDKTVPEDVVGRYSRLFQILEGSLNRVFGEYLDFSTFECRNLVELQVMVGDKEGLTGVKRLLRTNPGIKTLAWMGVETIDGSVPVLDAEDFEGLTGLENLNLQSWDCSGNGRRQLRLILRLVGGSLKDLRLAGMYDVSPNVFSTSALRSSLQQQEVVERPDESVRLAHLEILELGEGGGLHLCAAELVKCCPKLKKLRYAAHNCDKSITRLAASLEKHCSEFESLECFEDDYYEDDYDDYSDDVGQG
ncbi:hypothetical protein BGX24_010563 [Mortierella sp. AD032]|nr:hypothetical protein BGX24_010563 [Mortierella sp. AD032]